MAENFASGKDPKLWGLAKKRAGFKSHFYTYVTINGFLWLIWLITTPAGLRNEGIPWPAWPLMGWGVGLAMHFVFTYIVRFDEKEETEREYQKLIRRKQ